MFVDFKDMFPKLRTMQIKEICIILFMQKAKFNSFRIFQSAEHPYFNVEFLVTFASSLTGLRNELDFLQVTF